MKFFDYFALLDKRDGNILHSRAYGSQQLDQSLLSGFFSSITSFAQSLLHEEFKSIVLSKSRFVVHALGDYLAIVYGPSSVPEHVVTRILGDVASMLQVLFCTSENWSRTLDLNGLDDILDYMLVKQASNITSLVGGVTQVTMDPGTSDHLDRLLSTLEDIPDIKGSMIILDGQVLHSLLPKAETRVIVTYANARPLTAANMSCVPVYLGSRWLHLLLIRLRSYTLALLATNSVLLDTLTPAIETFETQLSESGVQMPVEAPPVLLRHFAGRDTVAFLYHNSRRGVSIAPRARPGAPSEQAKARSLFQWLFARASLVLSTSTTNALTLHHDSYHFYATVDDQDELYVLYTAQVRIDHIKPLSDELLGQLRGNKSH